MFCKVVAGRAGNKPALPAHSCFIRMGACKSESRVFAHLSVDLWCKPSTDVLSCRRIFDRKHQARHASIVSILQEKKKPLGFRVRISWRLFA